MRKLSILFGSVRDTSRSRIAAGLLRSIAPDDFIVESAGLEDANEIDPVAIEVMDEVGIDITKTPPQKVFDLVKQEKEFSYVVTVCDESSAEKYPIFPNVLNIIHLDVPDPYAMEGSHEEKVHRMREIRDKIKEKLVKLADDIRTGKIKKVVI